MDDLNVREIVLERLRMQALGAFSKQLLRVETSDALTFHADQLVVRLVTDLLAYQTGHGIVVFPATPWDHLKQKWCSRLGRIGRWYLRRHPVREDARPVTTYLTFPEANIRFPDELAAPRIYTLETR